MRLKLGMYALIQHFAKFKAEFELKLAVDRLSYFDLRPEECLKETRSLGTRSPFDDVARSTYN
jgi:hypothetical protein